MNETDKTPADWVLLEAARRSNWPYHNLAEDGGLGELRRDYDNPNTGFHGAYVSLCDMIAKHEQPPVDPDFEAVKQIFASVGMSLRDYFAGQVLVGMATSFYEGAVRLKMTQKDADETLASSAYAMADAMLHERGK